MSVLKFLLKNGKKIGNEITNSTFDLAGKEAKSSLGEILVKKSTSKAQKVPVFSDSNPITVQEAYDKLLNLKNNNTKNIQSGLVDYFSRNNGYGNNLKKQYLNAINNELGVDNAKQLGKIVSDYTKLYDTKSSDYESAKEALEKYLLSDSADDVINKSSKYLEGKNMFRAQYPNQNGISYSIDPSVVKNQYLENGKIVKKGKTSDVSRVIAPQYTEVFQPSDLVQKEAIGFPDYQQQITQKQLDKYISGGRGNWGHSGRKGKVGGSVSKSDTKGQDYVYSGAEAGLSRGDNGVWRIDTNNLEQNIPKLEDILKNNGVSDTATLSKLLGQGEYRMSHRPTKTGITGDNLLKTGTDDIALPSDIYDNPQYYTGYPEGLEETINSLRSARGNPDKTIPIYRATTGDTINYGDWITLSEDYAKKHNQSWLDGKGNIVKMEVPAKYVQHAGDDLSEFGYFPNNIELDEATSIALDNAMKYADVEKSIFPDSVIRDADGNLKKMYHGSPNGEITEFKPGTYFTENKEYADGYQNPEASSLTPGAYKTINNPKTYEVYLDVKKPFTLKDDVAKDIYINEYIKGGNSQYFDPYTDYRNTIDNLEEIDWIEGEDLMEWLKENHPEYDALYLDEGGTGGYSPDNEYKWRGVSVIPFNSNQIKNLN